MRIELGLDLDVQAEEIPVRLASSHDPVAPIVYEYDGWAKDLVIARCHRMAICARHGYRQHIADGRVLWKLSVGHQNVAGLTVLADDLHGRQADASLGRNAS